MTNNYFAVLKEPFFFNDRDPQSTHDAWEAARRYAANFPKSRISIFRQLLDNPRTMYLIGEAPEIPDGHEVTSWRADGWTSRARVQVAP